MKDLKALSAQWWNEYAEGAAPGGQEALEKLLRAIKVQTQRECLANLEQIEELERNKEWLRKEHGL